MGAGAFISFLDLALLARAKSFLDEALWHKELALFFQQALFLLGIFIAVETLRFWQTFQAELVAKRFCQRLQDALVAGIVAAPMSLFLSQPRGDLLQRVMKDADRISYFSGYFLSSLLREPLRALFFAGILFYTSPSFGLLALGGGAAALLAARMFQRRVASVCEELRQNEGTLFQRLETLLQHFPFLKAYNSGGVIYQHWLRTNQRVLQLNTRATRFHLMHALFHLLFMVGMLGLLFLAAWGNWGLFPSTPGTVALIAAATYFCFSGLRQTATQWTGLTDEWVRARKLAEILEWPPEKSLAETPREFPQPLREVRIEDLAFGYHPEKTVLSGVDWKLQAGSAMALIGPNGSGKTTLSFLLLRLLEPQRGVIYYDGIPASQLDLTSLRRRVGLVFQEPFLIDGTLRENLLYNVDEIPFGAQQEALHVVGLGALAPNTRALESFQIGPKGQGLSYGERQRLALARALLANPDLLILDEAASALDPDSEHQILAEVLRRRADKMTLLISPRVKTPALPLEKYLLNHGKLTRLAP